MYANTTGSNMTTTTAKDITKHLVRYNIQLAMLKKRLTEFKTTLEQKEAMHEFDPAIFENMIEKIIIGEVNEQGNKNPYKITFVFKTGYTSDVEVPPPKKAGRPSKKGSEIEVINSETENNFVCSHEIGHTVVVIVMV